MTEPPVIDVRDLHVDFPGRDGTVHAVRGVDLRVRRGETVALVGESGCGKSVTARALLGLIPSPGRVVAGSVRIEDRDLVAMSEHELQRLRGGRIGLVFQDPQSSLNPVMTVGRQIAEAMTVHGRSPAQARAHTVELLALAGVPDPARRVDDYPHQFSGGMRQRVMIALAIANDPAVLVADEPTTALDVTVQAQILEVFARLNAELGTAIVLISHNLGVVARLCQRVVVMYAGRVVEEASVDAAYGTPAHPYTWELLRAVPRLASGLDKLPSLAGRPPDLRQLPIGCAFAPRCRFAEQRCAIEDPPLSGEAQQRGVTEDPPRSGDAEQHRAACWVTAAGRRLPSLAARERDGEQRQAPSHAAEVLAVDDVVKTYPGRRGAGRRRPVQVLSGVSLRLHAGETLGLVGESGCGKSTLARLVLGLERPESGTVLVRGEDLTQARGARRKALRRQVQLVFQDPYASLNPRHTVMHVVAEPLRVHDIVPRPEIPRRVATLLEMVGLDPATASRLPRDFSGGQRQRIALARALAVQPSLLVLDEPISALDVTLQAQIVGLLDDLQRRLGVAYLFIAHDVAVVRRISHRIAVMHLGEVVETGPANAVCATPAHPYTVSLLSAVPEPDPAAERARERIILAGDMPSPLDPPSGCRFHTRCPVGPAYRSDRERCRSERPVLREVTPGRWAACHFAAEVLSSPPGHIDAAGAVDAIVAETPGARL